MGDLHEAQKLKETAESKLKEYSKIIEDSKREAKKIIEDSKKKLDNDIEILEEFMKDLASVLISGFKQNIITIVSPHRTIMLERQHV